MSALLFASLAAAFASEPAHVQREVSRLEAQLRSGKLKEPQKTRLAELYFLLSRCDDVRKLVPEGPLACVCGGGCVGESSAARVEMLRRLLEGGARWDDKRVRKLWDIVGNLPEARYWALKAMSVNRDPKLRAMRSELEKSLEGLEVK
jgi:hypothetical protein